MNIARYVVFFALGMLLPAAEHAVAVAGDVVLELKQRTSTSVRSCCSCLQFQ